MRFSKRAFCSISVATGLAAGMMGMPATCQAGESNPGAAADTEGFTWIAEAWGHALDFKLPTAGARFGVGGNTSSHDFNEAEVFLDWNLPWRWDLGRNIWLQTRVDSSAGWLGESGGNAAIFNLGPGLRLGHKHFPLSFELGADLTLLTQTRFATKDFDSVVEFTTYAGLSADLGAHVRFGYRYQHMSNANLSDNNPGLNLHMFSLSYVF
jgi:hypothetical protein